jgi:hypothetical protein
MNIINHVYTYTVLSAAIWQSTLEPAHEQRAIQLDQHRVAKKVTYAN